MRAIRAHFDGRVIVPDEPLELPADSKVTVLIQTPEEDARIADETKKYYQSLTEEEKAEDAEWGRGVAKRLPNAWE